MTPDGITLNSPSLKSAIRDGVRDELASLGGHLLATYGPTDPKSGPHIPDLATLGGYLLEFYSHRATVAYRDPTPPAVGEPPTTTPGGTA